MDKGTIAKIVIFLGILILIKLLMNPVPKISEPITNAVVFAGFLIFAIYMGLSEFKKHARKNTKNLM